MSVQEPKLLFTLRMYFMTPYGETREDRYSRRAGLRSEIYNYVRSQDMGVVEKEIYEIQDDRWLRVLRGIGMPGRLSLAISRQELTLLSQLASSPRELTGRPFHMRSKMVT